MDEPGARPMFHNSSEDDLKLRCPLDGLKTGSVSKLQEQSLHSKLQGMVTGINSSGGSSKINRPINESLVMSRMALNTNKAGMEGLDKDKIDRIILEASKGSRFYENEQKKESDTSQRLVMMKQKLRTITERDKLRAIEVMDRLTNELESARDLSRTIVHLDMDAFYAAVEMRDNPSLKNMPMAVGSMSMLCTSNYLARRFGVRAAMPGFIAKKLCPDLILVPLNFEKYQKASKQVQDILKAYDPNFCPMSLDEAYLDLTEHLAKRQSLTDEERTYCKQDDNKKKDANNQCNLTNEMKRHFVTFGLTDVEAVNEIRFRIEAETQLTASAGIAPNMMLAKVCSDKNKPNGQYKIKPTRDAVISFVRTLPIRKVSGIGKVTERILKSLNIETCGDLYVQRGILHLLFSEISSQQFLQTSLGLGSTIVQKSSERKSISVERTFKELSMPSDLYLKLNELCHSVSNQLHKEGLMGRTLTIKLKTVKFEVKSRSTSLSSPTNSVETIYESASELLRVEIKSCQHDPLKLRLMGVRISSLISVNALQGKQGTLQNFFQKAKSNSESQKHSSDAEMFSRVTEDCKTANDCYISGQFIESQLLYDNGLEMSHSKNDIFSLSGKANDALEGSIQEFVCPICNTVQQNSNLDKFNIHVDLCLNDSTIKSILSEQEHNSIQKIVSPSKTSLKRRCVTETSSAKRKKNDDNQNTIEKYLKS